MQEQLLNLIVFTNCPYGNSRNGILVFYGVGDGTRTHNARNHNPVLCQLNYTHHIHLNAEELGTPGGTRFINVLLGQALAINMPPAY